MTEPEVNKPRSFRFTLGGMIVLVAVIAVGFAVWRPKGTRIIDVKAGTGPAVKAGDRVAVHYVGKLTDGKVFDSSKARGVPIDLVVGRGMVIKGWDVGLVGMKAGGSRELTIPPDEAYGEKGHPPVIPPSSTLIFDVDLVKIY